MRNVGNLCLYLIFSIFIFNLFLESSAEARSFLRGRQAARMTASGINRSLNFKIKPKLNIRKVTAGPVSALALSPDEHYLVTVVGKNKLRLWDLHAGREVALISSEKSTIVDLAISPDSSTCVYTCSDGSVYVWNFFLTTFQQIKNCPASDRVSFTPEGFVWLGGLRGEITLVNPVNNDVLLTQRVWKEGFSGLVSNTAGKVFLATTTGVFVIDSRSGELLCKIQTSVPPTAVSCDANLLAWGDEDGLITVWDIDKNKKKKSIQGEEEQIASIDINQNVMRGLISNDEGEIYSVDLKTGKMEILGSHDEKVCFSRMDKNAENALTASADGTCKLWNLESKKLMLTLVSAVDGWLVVDEHGRFDGTQAALDGVDWEDGDHVMNINNFSENYYEPNLIPRVMHSSEKLDEVISFSEGIHLAAKVNINGESGDSKKALIRVSGSDNKGSGIRQLKLYQNGKRVPDELGQTVAEAKKNKFPQLVKEYSLDLAKGENKFSAIAINDEKLESAPAELVIQGEKTNIDSTLWVVTIGINKYAFADLSLDYARLDAQALYNYFNFKNDLPVVQKKMVHLFDQKATRDSIINVFNALQYLPREDLVVIYMAGHGVIIEDKWYFLPYNITEASERAVVQNGISTEEFKNKIENVGADRMLLLIDACQSGGALSPIKNFIGIKSLRMLARDMGVHILAATDREQYAVELKALGHGVFTYSLLEALNGKAADQNGKITVRNVMKYVEREVPALSQKYANYAQFPISHSRGHDFKLSGY